MKKEEYNYLFYLYNRINDFLSDEKWKDHELGDIIVSFCTVFEKILKIKLYKKNPMLVYDSRKLKDNNEISAKA